MMNSNLNANGLGGFNTGGEASDAYWSSSESHGTWIYVSGFHPYVYWEYVAQNSDVRHIRAVRNF